MRYLFSLIDLWKCYHFRRKDMRNKSLSNGKHVYMYRLVYSTHQEKETMRITSVWHWEKKKGDMEVYQQDSY
jgi:hypothetical protein